MTLEAHLKRLIRNYYRRLQKLKEREALYGLDVTPGISLEIEDIEEKIAELEQELNEIRDRVDITAQALSTSSLPHHDKSLSLSTFPPPVDYQQISLLNRNPALRQLRRWLLQK